MKKLSLQIFTKVRKPSNKNNFKKSESMKSFKIIVLNSYFER